MFGGKTFLAVDRFCVRLTGPVRQRHAAEILQMGQTQNVLCDFSSERISCFSLVGVHRFAGNFLR